MVAESPCGGPRRFWGTGGEEWHGGRYGMRARVAMMIRPGAGRGSLSSSQLSSPRAWLSVVAVVVGPCGGGWSPGGGVRGRIWSQNRPAGDRGARGGPRRFRGTVGEPAPPPTASHRTHLHIDPDLPAQLRCFPVLDLSGSQPAPASGPDPPSFGGGAACSSGLQFRRSSGCHPPGQDPRSRFQSWHTGPWRWCVRRGSAKSTKNRNGSRT